ncbi:L-rhamnose isomerase, partial [Salmonella enterica]|uniref:L-rhamnose isomerase n=1 Tax=Salmonella enterica TaxID=28901 RepID=UPI00398C31AF
TNTYTRGAATRSQHWLCMKQGNIHPPEGCPATIAAARLEVPRMLLHVGGPVRWGRDHVVRRDDETQAIASESVRHNLFDRVHIGLDFFDDSINRVAAWVLGTRTMKKALLPALLEPTDQQRQFEARRDSTALHAPRVEQK